MTLATLAVACGLAAPTPPPDHSLEGREFLSAEITDAGAPRSLVPGTRVSLRFEDGRIGLSAGCNSIGGAYRVEEGRLLVGELSMTAMGCDPARHAQDEWLSTFVGSGPTVALAGADLTLTGGDLRMTLVDRVAVEPDAPLVGPRWMVDAFIAGDAVSSMPGAVEASLVFGDDGRLSLDTGCNEGGGAYAIEDAFLQLGAMALTRRGCPGPEGSVETQIMEVLGGGAVAYAIHGQLLTLEAGGRGLILRAGQPAG